MIDFQNLGSIPCCVFHRARIVSLLIIISITPLLVGCASAVVGGGAAVGVAALEERTIGTVTDDTKTAAQLRLLVFDKLPNHALRIGIEMFEGRALLTGAVPTEQVRADAVRLAWTVEGVKDVLNEIQISSSGIIDTARDVWITTQLTWKITFDENIHAINYVVETVNGTVYLIGIAQNRMELDRAIGYARGLNYVQKVISHVRLKAGT